MAFLSTFFELYLTFGLTEVPLTFNTTALVFKTLPLVLDAG
jgi:hypothetical protein